MEKNTYAIEVKKLHKSFGKLKVLSGVDLNVKRGQVLALLGPNGAGKTTTIRILSTLLLPDSGTVTVEGLNVVKQANDVRSVIGLTGQYAAVDEFLTGRENLHMMGRLYHLSRKDTKRRTEELLTQFDLQKAANRAAKTYSGGMRRRLDLALSLIASPPIIFLDEPTTGLDPRSRLAMWAIIKQLVREGSTILLTTQYLDEADQLADSIAVIDGGKVIAEGTADELKRKVGKDQLELNFKTLADLQNAVSTIGSKNVVVDNERLSLSTPSSGIKRMQEILTKLSNANVKVDGISLHKPTLDDVFMSLTGHSASKQETPEKKGKK